MKIELFLTVTLILQYVSCHREKSYLRDTLAKSVEITANKNLDLRGTLRKSFFVVSALQQPKNNTVCSPISALLPLGKLGLGAEGTSLDQLLEAIGVESVPKIKPHFKYLIAEMRYLPGVRLDVASRLYVGMQTRLVAKFNDKAKEIFTSSVERVDFDAPVYTAERISDWVESQTNDMIKNMVKAEEIHSDLSLILVNAVYFMGKWKEPFSLLQTSTFHTPVDVRRIVMMSITSHFEYTDSETLDSKIINLPYEGGKASFVIVLPNAKNGLPLLLNQLKLAPELLDSELGQLKTQNVHLIMPKFKIESELDLGYLYKRIGVTKIFDDGESGLTGIVKNQVLVVSSAKQKAVIDVTEFGTEASAASSTILAKLSLEKAIQFKADHPFLFLILSSKQQLFAGTLVTPPIAN